MQLFADGPRVPAGAAQPEAAAVYGIGNKIFDPFINILLAIGMVLMPLAAAATTGAHCAHAAGGGGLADVPCPSRCRSNGVCLNGTCACTNGYGGLSCKPQCDRGCYGHGRCAAPGQPAGEYG